jgi:hypothetical protein
VLRSNEILVIILAVDAGYQHDMRRVIKHAQEDGKQEFKWIGDLSVQTLHMHVVQEATKMYLQNI